MELSYNRRYIINMDISFIIVLAILTFIILANIFLYVRYSNKISSLYNQNIILYNRVKTLEYSISESIYPDLLPQKQPKMSPTQEVNIH